MNFEKWLEELNTIALSKGHLGKISEETGKECWEEYFSEGLSPAEAYAEDVAHG